MSPAPEARVFQILLVEDNQGDVFLIRQALADAGLKCQLTVISDGAKALAFLRNLKEGGHPDLAVLDLNIPRKSGTEVLAALRLNQGLADIPVVVFTSSFSGDDRAKVERLGVERYFTKGPGLDDYLRIGAELKEILLRRNQDRNP